MSILATCQRQLDHALTLGLQPEIQQILLEIFNSPELRELDKNAVEFFSLTPLLNQEGRIVMMNNFQAMHLSVLSVSALKVRIDKDPSYKLAEKAEIQLQISEIIAEDVGLQGLTHHALFERFAHAITGTTRWHDGATVTPEVKNFRDSLSKIRTNGDIQDALATLIVSEIWNTGEYTHGAPIMESHLSQGTSASSFNAKNCNAYMSVHAGDTEFDHFMHAVSAFCTYSATQNVPMQDMLRTIQETSLRYFDGLNHAFVDTNIALRKFLVTPALLNPSQTIQGHRPVIS